MSVRMMSMVFDRYPHGDAEMLLALALADHADEHGERIYPGVPTLALKTRQTERSVQRQLRKMEDMGWLECIFRSKGGRSKPSQYRISPRWIGGMSLDQIKAVDNLGVIHNGDNLSPFKNGETVTLETETVTPVVRNGDIAVSPEPSITINNHHLSAREIQNGEETANPMIEAIADRLSGLGVKVASSNAELGAWVQAGLTMREAVECVRITRMTKPDPEPIPFSYLSKVIATQRNKTQGNVQSITDSGMPTRPWYLDSERIAAKAFELRMVHGTVTDRRQVEDVEFQRWVLEKAAITADEWAQWRSWRKIAA